ncbi:helix-turn-helix domain-containing protein [Pseudoalteromonas sp. T1lg65]|uniref:helix-turn-helix domain-containing protein n=1 Tax=Pseudoalteromonas sp. T1lg65 TaxID=2077101 RepID=UPI003F79CCAB
MIVRTLRKQKGWTQDQLASFSGLNVRTIQRIEHTDNASIESLKSLAAVFEISTDDLQQELNMDNTSQTAHTTNKNDQHLTENEDIKIRDNAIWLNTSKKAG